MRYMHFTHAVFAALLWSAAVFAFVGITFMIYDQAAYSMQGSRMEIALSEMRRLLQNEMDKGHMLSHLSAFAEKHFFYYTSDDPDVVSVSAFEPENGKVLFSTQRSLAGGVFPENIRAACRQNENVFFETSEESRSAGLALYNALNEKTGCLLIEYKNDTYKEAKNKMMRVSLRIGSFLAFVGILFCVFFSFMDVSSEKKGIRPYSKRLMFFGSLLFLAALVPFFLSSMFASFEGAMRKGVSLKTQLISRVIQTHIQGAVQRGMLLKSISGAEVYLDGIRKKNPEILYILVTDKTGRVLYESGSAKEAFKSDARTGKVSLRSGYYNTGEPVYADQATVGWVQIGVKERFVREKIY